jgi:hypothetical protein
MSQRLLHLAFAVLLVPIALWGADRQAGVWKLNLEKSKYPSDVPVPKSETLNIQEQENGIKYTVTREGEPSFHFEYSARYDGKDYPVTGSPEFDTVVLKRINDSTIEDSRKKDGKLVWTLRAVVSKDGKTRTLYWKGKNAKGEPRTAVFVFDKE